jgi:hypothetical protein
MFYYTFDCKTSMREAIHDQGGVARIPQDCDLLSLSVTLPTFPER